MGKRTPTATANHFRNALGTAVYYQSFGQQLTRSRVVPANTATPARTRVRQFLKDSATIWKDDLTDYERRAWRTAALTAPHNPHRNQRGQLSGWQYFHQVNLALQNIDKPTLIDPPERQPPDRIETLTVNTINATTQTILLDFTGAPGPNSHICVYATGNRLTSQFSANGTTAFIQSFPPGTTTPLDISAAWTAKYGTLLGNRRVNFQACTCNAIDGSLSARSYATAPTTGSATVASLLGYITPTTLTPPQGANFAWINQGASAYSQNAETALWLHSDAPKGSANLVALIAATPATPWSAILGCIPFSGSNNNNPFRAGIVLRESSSGKLIEWSPQIAGTNNLGLLKWNSPTSAGSTYTYGNVNGRWPLCWFKITDDGTNFTFFVGPDGQNWQTWYTAAVNDWFTTDADGVGICIMDEYQQGGVLGLHWSLA